VPAGRLGWDPAHEGGFIDWLQRQHGAYGPADFVPRMLLGDYLAQSLAVAEQAATARGVKVQTLVDSVRGLTPLPDGGYQLQLAGGASCRADRVVLTTGHLAPESPRVPGAPAWGSPALIDQPWNDAALAALPEDGDVLLLGSGLSAIDMLTWLQDRGHVGCVTMLSRRGLLPQPHRSLEARPRPGLAPAQALEGARGLVGMLRAVRRWATQAHAEGHDWRDVMANLRGCTPGLWQRLSTRERRQFLRHLQPWWDTHRHRLAPGIHCRLQASLRAGQVELHAGRLSEIKRRDDGLLDIAWRPRGASGALVHRRVAAVVNFTRLAAGRAAGAGPPAGRRAGPGPARRRPAPPARRRRSAAAGVALRGSDAEGPVLGSGRNPRAACPRQVGGRAGAAHAAGRRAGLKKHKGTGTGPAPLVAVSACRSPQ
jgi:uncharacterized NAD(P)/FAD-binding protein YdhS